MRNRKYIKNREDFIWEQVLSDIDYTHDSTPRDPRERDKLERQQDKEMKKYGVLVNGSWMIDHTHKQYQQSQEIEELLKKVKGG